MRLAVPTSTAVVRRVERDSLVAMLSQLRDVMGLTEPLRFERRNAMITFLQTLASNELMYALLLQRSPTCYFNLDTLLIQDTEELEIQLTLIYNYLQLIISVNRPYYLLTYNGILSYQDISHFYRPSLVLATPTGMLPPSVPDDPSTSTRTRRTYARRTHDYENERERERERAHGYCLRPSGYLQYSVFSSKEENDVMPTRFSTPQGEGRHSGMSGGSAPRL